MDSNGQKRRDAQRTGESINRKAEQRMEESEEYVRRYRIPDDTGCRIQDTRIQDTGYRIQDTRIQPCLNRAAWILEMRGNEFN